MFRKTKFKLVSLYTIVFFFILCIFGLSLYVYMYRSTYISIDEKLNEKAAAITAHSGKEIPEENEHETERRIAYLFWGQNRTLLRSYPNNVFLQKDLSIIYTREHDKKPQTVTIKGQYYRFVSIQTHDLKVNNKPIKLIQLLYNIDPEVNLLKTMLILIGIGCAAGLVLSWLVGLFLANKALVPIQRSWEKQSRFVADASHELRTPLAVIQTHLELLFRHPSKTVEEESETIFKSLSEVKRINKLVEELLTLARSDSNEQQINPNYFMMDELLQLIVEQFKPIASMKEIHLKKTTEKNLNY
jgi:two-component system sensor histidine kinase CiaH